MAFVHHGQTYQIGIKDLIKYLKDLEGTKILDHEVDGKRLRMCNLTPMDETEITEIIHELQYGKVYFLPSYNRDVALFRTGVAVFKTTQKIK